MSFNFNFQYKKKEDGGEAKPAFGAGSYGTKKAAEKSLWKDLTDKINENNSLDTPCDGFILELEKFSDFTLMALRCIDYISAGSYTGKISYGESDPKKSVLGGGTKYGFGAKKEETPKTGLFGQAQKQATIDFANTVLPTPTTVHPESAKISFLPSSFSQKSEQGPFRRVGSIYSNVIDDDVVSYPTLFDKKIPATEVPYNIEPQHTLNVVNSELTKEHMKENPLDREKVNVSIPLKITSKHYRLSRDGIATVDFFDIDIENEIYNVFLGECFIDIEGIIKPGITRKNNSKAFVTMYSVWPKDARGIRTASNFKGQEESYENCLRDFCDSNELKFVRYTPKHGVFIFIIPFKDVRHSQFSIP
jgi:hypothetical protein